MQHHFSTWSDRLAIDVRERYANKLRLIDQVLSDTDDGTVKELRQTALRNEIMPQSALETAQAALECAIVCRHSHQADFDALCAVMKVVIKGDLPVDSAGLKRFLQFLAQSDSIDPQIMPVAEVLGQVERELAGRPAPADWRPLLETIHQAVARGAPKPSKSIESLLARINLLSNESVAARLKPDDGWADLVVQDLAGMNDSDRREWNALLSHASAITPEPPAADWDVESSEVQVDINDLEAHHQELLRLFFLRAASAGWTEASNQRIAAVGDEPFRSLRLRWLRAVPGSKPGTLSQFSVNRELLRGILGTCEQASDPELAGAVRMAAEFFFRNNSPLGRFAVWLLSRMTAPTALDELALLRTKVKAGIQIELIEAAREVVAARSGVPLQSRNDVPLPTSGFTELGKRLEVLSGFGAELAITPSGAVDLRWFKPGGAEQKSIPAQVKRAHDTELRNLKAAAREVESTLATARQLLEFASLERWSWSLDHWRQRYFNHPVAGTVARRLLWEFDHSGTVTVGAFDNRWLVNKEGSPLEFSGAARVSLWHPFGSPVADVLAWRELLAKNNVTQPFKQAHREIYLLTEAERSSRTYSNRFAAHILKQSQFRVLAKTRRWKTEYLGHWSSGDHECAERELPEWELRAELWLNGVSDESAPAGGFMYLSTDQVRFCPTGSRDPLPLDQVPPLVFSEVMRDVDLFVSVAGVGNDPTWADGGPEGRLADYWEQYAFGDLSETARTRRAVLERIIPQLKIADRCTISDRFLVVRGNLHTYKIHLGSANVMMEPDSQYLCIVPAGSDRSENAVYLPFEGDSRLSVILSKALLLADDQSITDRTIVSQIRGNGSG